MQGAKNFLSLQATITEPRFCVTTQIVYREDALGCVAEQNLAAIKLDTLDVTLGQIAQRCHPGILLFLQSSILPKKFVQGKVNPPDSGLLVITQCHPTVRAGFHALLLL